MDRSFQILESSRKDKIFGFCGHHSHEVRRREPGPCSLDLRPRRSYSPWSDPL